MKTKPSPGTAVKIFGRTAVMVKQPNGDVAAYLISELSAAPMAVRTWSVTSEGGSVYAVSEMRAGWWSCSCPAATAFTKHGLSCEVPDKDGKMQRVCKHSFSVWRWLNPAPEPVTPGLFDEVPEESG